MRDDSLGSVLAKQNEAILPLVELDAPFVAEDQLAHQLQQGHDRLLAVSVGTFVFFGFGLVALGLLLFVFSFRVLPRAQQQGS